MSLSSGALLCFKSHLPTLTSGGSIPLLQTQAWRPLPGAHSLSNLQPQLVNFMLGQLASQEPLAWADEAPLAWSGSPPLQPPPFEFCGALICIFNYVSNA